MFLIKKRHKNFGSLSFLTLLVTVSVLV